ncbi:MAG: TolC family protein [Nannocystis sp.]|nr:TolC family protein [Nannocystis sp.]MBA3549056.1 TolC family protein [Nannocystis sp.]
MAATLLGCASVQPTQARRDVGELVEQRVGLPDAIPEQQDAESRARVRARVDELMTQPLTVDRALQVAMLNNRGLRATLEDLGVAQAELVQAGLLQNPVISGDLVNSTRGNGLGGGLALSQSLLSVFLIPAQRRVAKARLAHAVVLVGQATLMLARDVRVAFVGAQAAEQALGLHRGRAQAAEVAHELAQRQFDAGNITSLDQQLFAAALDRARVELADAQLDTTRAREELTRLLGLWGEDVAWTFAGPLDSALPPETELGSLEQQGMRDRLDLSAARFETRSIEYALTLRRRGMIPELNVGISARNEVGNDVGHEWVLGPSLSLELPIFDPGHADIARIQAYLRQAQHRLQDVAIHVRSEIRVHRAELVAARRKVEYYERTVLPRTESITELTLQQYNAMLVGTYQLLETRTDQIDARQEYVEALRDYWVARSELELAVGGRLPTGRQ